MANDVVSILLASDVFLWLYFGPQSGTSGVALAKKSQELLQNVRYSRWYQAYVAESTLDYIAKCIEEEQGLDVAEQVFRTLSQNLYVLAGAATAANLQEIQSQEALIARHNDYEIVSHFAADYAALTARVCSVDDVLEQLGLEGRQSNKTSKPAPIHLLSSRSDSSRPAPGGNSPFIEAIAFLLTYFSTETLKGSGFFGRLSKDAARSGAAAPEHTEAQSSLRLDATHQLHHIVIPAEFEAISTTADAFTISPLPAPPGLTETIQPLPPDTPLIRPLDRADWDGWDAIANPRKFVKLDENPLHNYAKGIPSRTSQPLPFDTPALLPDPDLQPPLDILIPLDDTALPDSGSDPVVKPPKIHKPGSIPPATPSPSSPHPPQSPSTPSPAPPSPEPSTPPPLNSTPPENSSPQPNPDLPPISESSGAPATGETLAAITELDGAGGRREFTVQAGQGAVAIYNFGGVGMDTRPTAQTQQEIDLLRLQGYGFTAAEMLLTQQGTDLTISFEGVSDTQIILKNFALELLDNLPVQISTGLMLGNIWFDQEPALQDSFDVLNHSQTRNLVFKSNAVTFLNDLNNQTRGVAQSSDVMNGQGGDDTLSGLDGNDILRGGSGDDALLGGSGSDRLVGNEGDDLLDGGTDADDLYGGLGRDRFVLSRSPQPDIIHDFRIGEDWLVLSNELSPEQLTIQTNSNALQIAFNQQILAILPQVQDINAIQNSFLSLRTDIA